MYHNRTTTVRSRGDRFIGSLLFALPLFLILILAISGCDSTDPITEEDVTFEGRVVEFPERGGEDLQGVEGARVTAWIHSGSGLQALPGNVTTDATGHFSLNTSGTTAAVVLRSEMDAFEASTLVEPGVSVSGTIRVPPMTHESTKQAEAYAEARSSSNRVHSFDAVAYVDAFAATALDAGTTSVEAVSAALASAVDAEVAYATHADGGGASDSHVSSVVSARTTAATDYRTALLEASTPVDREQARIVFERAYVTAYSGAGISYNAQAEASLVNARAAARFSGELSTASGFAAARQAQILAAYTVATAIEKHFEDAGAEEFRLIELAQARAEFMAAIRTAGTGAIIAEAYNDYRGVVFLHLAGETGLNASLIEAAFVATSPIRAALQSNVLAATNPEMVASAFVTFFTAVQDATRQLFDLGVEGAWAADIVALLSVH